MARAEGFVAALEPPTNPPPTSVNFASLSTARCRQAKAAVCRAVWNSPAAGSRQWDLSAVGDFRHGDGKWGTVLGLTSDPTKRRRENPNFEVISDLGWPVICAEKEGGREQPRAATFLFGFHQRFSVSPDSGRVRGCLDWSRQDNQASLRNSSPRCLKSNDINLWEMAPHIDGIRLDGRWGVEGTVVEEKIKQPAVSRQVV